MTRLSPRAKLTTLPSAVRRHRPCVLLLWALGAVVFVACALALSDPAIVMFALDPELVAVLVLGSVALLRSSPAVVVARGLVGSVARTARRLARVKPDQELVVRR